MSVHWLLAKYMTDLRRREPINIGVILFFGDEILSKFLGELEPGGQIDGRVVKGKVSSTKNYKAWIDYWRSAAAEQSFDELLHRLGDANYFLERGGSVIHGEKAKNPSALLEELYALLVEDPAKVTRVVAESIDRAEQVLRRLELLDRVQQNAVLEGNADKIHFDYRYKNGVSTWMRRVALREGRSGWDHVHAAAWALEKAKVLRASEGDRVVALLEPSSRHQDATQQARFLEEQSPTINLEDTARAASQLSDLIGVRMPGRRKPHELPRPDDDSDVS